MTPSSRLVSKDAPWNSTLHMDARAMGAPFPSCLRVAIAKSCPMAPAISVFSGTRG